MALYSQVSSSDNPDKLYFLAFLILLGSTLQPISLVHSEKCSSGSLAFSISHSLLTNLFFHHFSHIVSEISLDHSTLWLAMGRSQWIMVEKFLCLDCCQRADNLKKFIKLCNCYISKLICSLNFSDILFSNLSPFPHLWIWKKSRTLKAVVSYPLTQSWLLRNLYLAEHPHTGTSRCMHDCPKLRFKLGGPDTGEMHPDVAACAWNLVNFSFLPNAAPHRKVAGEIGRASCRERVWRWV